MRPSYTNADSATGGGLAARLLRRPAELDQFRHDDVAMIALNFDDAVAHGTAGSAALLEPGGQGVDVGRRHRQPRDRRDALACPALDLPSHAHRGGLGGPGNSLGAHAFTHRLAAVGAEAADSG